VPLVGVALAAVVAVAVFRSHGPGAGPDRVPVPQEVMNGLVQVPQSTWDGVGAAGVTPPRAVDAGAAPGGKPVVLYVGAEFCPYCAAQRWSLVAALARFGTFRGLALSRSSSTDVYPDTPTFTFYGASYESPYVELQAVETRGRVAGPDGNYPPLQSLTPQQDALVRRYDPDGSVPFLLVGGRFLWLGSSFSPGLLQGSWQSIAAALPAGRGAAARAILANANAIAAAVCAVDGGQPASVCGSAGVTAAARTLPAAPAS
jgi:thiol-disulfide isomerase/thioredoxin